MDMKKILQNMDDAVAGNKPSAAAEDVSGMKNILESFDNIDATLDPMPEDLKRIDEMASMNISMSGDDANEVAQLVAIMRGTGADAKPVDTDMINPPMDKLKAIVGPKMPTGDMDDLKPGVQKEPCKVCGKVHLGNSGCGESTEENWENGEDEQYYDQHTMTKDLSGGINRPKKQYKAANRGDNAMAMEDRIKEELWNALQEKFTAEGRGRGKKKTKEDVKTTEGRGRGKKVKEDTCPKCGKPGKKKLMACASCGCS